jgi:hypothetical protein
VLAARPDEHILMPLGAIAMELMAGLYWDIGEGKYPARCRRTYDARECLFTAQADALFKGKADVDCASTPGLLLTRTRHLGQFSL